MSLAALLQKDLMLAYIYSSRPAGLAGVSCASFLLLALDIRCCLIPGDVATKDLEQEAPVAMRELAKPADQLANHANIFCADMLIVFELSTPPTRAFPGIAAIYGTPSKRHSTGML